VPEESVVEHLNPLPRRGGGTMFLKRVVSGGKKYNSVEVVKGPSSLSNLDV
jgi:hypothetical protein